MKSKITFLLLSLIPSFASAQWNQVRYDQVNYYAKAYAITESSVVVAGMDQMSSGAFFMRTNDGGLTWDSISVSSPSVSYQFEALKFTDMNTGYAGGIKNNLQALVKTIDNGSTWSEVTPDTASLNAIKSISFVDQQYGFAATRYNIYKTVDGGSTWITMNVPAINMEDIYFVDMNTGYAGGENAMHAELYKTTDGGATWYNVMTATIPTLFMTGSRKIDAVSATTIFTSLLYSNILLRTMDGGLTWDTLTVPQIYEVQDYDFINVLSGHVLSSMGEIFGTSDGGVTWNYEYSVAGGAYGPSVFLSSISFVDDIGYVCGSSGLIKKHDPSVTSIIESERGNSIYIYPNPAVQNELINFNINVKNIKFYNCNGQTILSKELNGSALSLMDPDLKPGIYNVVASDDINFFNAKLIIAE